MTVTAHFSLGSVFLDACRSEEDSSHAGTSLNLLKEEVECEFHSSQQLTLSTRCGKGERYSFPSRPWYDQVAT